MMHVENTMKEPSEIIQHLLKLFDMFNIRILYDKYNVPDSLGIKCIYCNKVPVYLLYNKIVKYAITFFVTNMVFQHVGIYWIIKSKEKLTFILSTTVLT